MIEGLIFYGIIGLLMSISMWLYRNDEKEAKELAPIDPIEVEARRLAEREVAELDWRCGTGPQPDWLKPKPPPLTALQKAEQKIIDAMAIPVLLTGDPSQTRFVKTVEEVAELAELAARDAERRGVVREIVTHPYTRFNKDGGVAVYGEIEAPKGSYIKLLNPPEARKWKKGELPDLPIEGIDYEIVYPETERHVLKNGLGKVVYDSATSGCPGCKNALLVAGPGCGEAPHYPRPRKTPRPAPPLTNKVRRG